MPWRVSSYREIETLMNFNYLNLFKPNDYTEDYYIRKPNDEKCLFQVKDNEKAFVDEKVISFQTDDKIVKNSPELGFNDIKYPLA